MLKTLNQISSVVHLDVGFFWHGDIISWFLMMLRLTVVCVSLRLSVRDDISALEAWRISCFNKPCLRWFSKPRCQTNFNCSVSSDCALCTWDLTPPVEFNTPQVYKVYIKFRVLHRADLQGGHVARVQAYQIHERQQKRFRGSDGSLHGESTCGGEDSTPLTLLFGTAATGAGGFRAPRCL